jgi:hypothetical protein
MFYAIYVYFYLLFTFPKVYLYLLLGFFSLFSLLETSNAQAQTYDPT